MSDGLPGSSWSNPIWHGKWRIYLGDSPLRSESYAYVHDDYDGDGDSRHGYAASPDACKAEIDDNFPDDAVRGGGP